MFYQQLSYAMSCLIGRLQPSRMRCPQCGSDQFERVSRKQIFTELVACSNCCLRYRIPQDPPKHYFDFYQNAYTSSLATECPTPEELSKMIASGFRSTEKNFTHRIEILSALGLKPGQDVLDYGASWGYATWQFRNHGFHARGFEISRPRARYARDMLGVDVIDEESKVPDQSLDCVFSSHVLEHVSAPKIAFAFGKRVLRSGGLFVAFTPNGSEACRQAQPDWYDHSWGRLHPLYLNAEFYASVLQDQPYFMTSSEYGEPYDLKEITSWDQTSQIQGNLSKRELLLVFRI
jgi:ubiquinone/menaquinone biosynthesis C-methylase UbiE